MLEPVKKAGFSEVKNVVAQFIGLPPLSLRGWRSQPKQSREGYEIATPRQVGARNDKKRCT
jgi:hypothetical protein